MRRSREASGTAVAVSCDVARPDDVDAAVRAAVDTYGRLDVMFNNAGVAPPRRGMLLEDHTDADFDRLVDVNARGVFVGCRVAVRQFKPQGDGGVMVNTGSIAGMVAWGSAVYGGTKAMVIQLTRALAMEGARGYPGELHLSGWDGDELRAGNGRRFPGGTAEGPR